MKKLIYLLALGMILVSCKKKTEPPIPDPEPIACDLVGDWEVIRGLDLCIGTVIRYDGKVGKIITITKPGNVCTIQRFLGDSSHDGFVTYTSTVGQTFWKQLNKDSCQLNKLYLSVSSSIDHGPVTVAKFRYEDVVFSTKDSIEISGERFLRK